MGDDLYSIRSRSTMSRKASLVIKRCIDIVVSAGAMLVLSPAMFIVAMIVWSRLGAPVFFRQPRPGIHGRPFVMLKFRTMSSDRDGEGRLLPDDQRLGKLGRVLRSFSLDELPELWNVFVGDMSLVGPRPLLMDYLPLYTDEQARRHEVRPGITGLAQVSGRNAISWEKKFELDVWYVDNYRLSLDALILWRTIRCVLSSDGVAQEGHATAERFRGGGT